jgi:hypothetical protein
MKLIPSAELTTARVAFITLFAVANSIFRDDYPFTEKALFLFITFDLTQIYDCQLVIQLSAAKMSIKPKMLIIPLAIEKKKDAYNSPGN